MIALLQHVPFEGPAHIAVWASSRGLALETTRLFAGESTPDVAAIDGLIVMGGPMNIYEEDDYPWLVSEKALIHDAIETGKPLVGVCLGAQLIADALGNKVVPVGQKEIGWFPLSLTEAGQSHPVFRAAPASFPVFHWHGETFALPEGAIHLARTSVCDTQAFIWKDRVLGLQCHLEMTRRSIDAIIDGCAHELELAQGHPWVQSSETMQAISSGELAHAHDVLERALDYVFDLQ